MLGLARRKVSVGSAPTASAPSETPASAPGEPLAFRACLAPGLAKAFTVDEDGECVLRLAIPLSDAQVVMRRFDELLKRSFMVALVLTPATEPPRDD